MKDDIHVDPGAMAIASVGATLVIITSEGPYNGFSAVIGLTLSAVVIAYGLQQRRSVLQSIAFGMMVGLCFVPLLGFVIEAPLYLVQLHQWPPYSKTAPDLVEPNWIVLGWLVTAVAFAIFEIRRGTTR